MDNKRDKIIINVFLLLAIINVIICAFHGIQLIIAANNQEPSLFTGYLVPSIKENIGWAYIIISPIVSIGIYGIGKLIVDLKNMSKETRTLIIFIILSPLIIFLLLLL